MSTVNGTISTRRAGTTRWWLSSRHATAGWLRENVSLKNTVTLAVSGKNLINVLNHQCYTSCRLKG